MWCGLCVAPLADKWAQDQLGVTIPVTAVDADLPGVDATEHLHAAEVSELYTHSTWTGVLFVAAKISNVLQKLAWEFPAIVQQPWLRTPEHSLHLWSLARPAHISVAGHVER